MSIRNRYLVIGLICLAWAVAMLLAYQWYQARYLRPFDQRAEVFSGETLALPDAIAGPGTIRVVHFWDPACPCNVGNQQHLAELLAHYQDQGVDFYIVQKPGTQGNLPPQLAGLRPLPGLPGSADLPASPAVAIWNSAGQLGYFGPYSEGAVCNAGNSFIEPIINALLQGRDVQATRSLAVGCFCDWRQPD
ncbi:DUF6436 domain-containing protein [Stutzerimonas kirkiae]|uniref:DUF6436 domain-containing protein n=1 Tax=Stutzerimonas kirkiae TaxID=2211392 RepID=UPI0010382F8F|nr:DUF6436 domain-containing protein [Stutzerimonas kirkiae]TBV08794.1 thiol-disulfide isomerase [Stutzerimonas kirkiae]TBV15629.1 thiol-disulfide isomerase [Stutzerimonas kirkiae]